MHALQITCNEAHARRLLSREHLRYARIEGELDGQGVTAVVRTDGSTAIESRLWARADLLVRLGENFDDGRLAASLSSSPLASTLTLMRACDRISALEIAMVGATHFLPPERQGFGTG